MDSTEISWTDSTFNPWLFPESFPTLQLAHVADTVRFEVPQFMAWVTKRDSIGDVVCQFRVLCHRLIVVGAQIAAFVITAISAGVFIPLKHGCSPRCVFGLATQVVVPLRLAVRVCVMCWSAWRVLPDCRANSGPTLCCVLFADSIGRPSLGRDAHFYAAFRAHLGALNHG